MSTGRVSGSMKMGSGHKLELPWGVKVANRDACFAMVGLAVQNTVQARIVHG